MENIYPNNHILYICILDRREFVKVECANVKFYIWRKGDLYWEKRKKENLI